MWNTRWYWLFYVNPRQGVLLCFFNDFVFSSLPWKYDLYISSILHIYMKLCSMDTSSFFFISIQEGKMKALDEKRINTTLNVWCRCKKKKERDYVIPRSSILIFRRRNRRLLWMVANYICGGEETRHIWHLIRKKN